jgi:23S rRNA pseudouridine1911/1915/1917 synthase
MIEKYIVTQEEDKIRLDKYVIKKVPEWISRNFIQTSIKEGKILVNDQTKKSSYTLKNGDIVSIESPDKPEKQEIHAEKIDIDIIYEDSELIVINKPYGMLVHPAGNIYSGTLVNALLEKIDSEQEERPGIVHRLDKDTSGVIIIAKNPETEKSLSNQFKDRLTKKTYLALVKNKFNKPFGKIDLPIGRHPIQRHKMCVMLDGKESFTSYKLLRNFGKEAALLSINIKTGRTHQIRVHLSHINHPVLGDYIYGNKKGINSLLNIERQMLHASKIGFYHPKTEKWLEFFAPLKNDFKNCLIQLDKYSKGEI